MAFGEWYFKIVQNITSRESVSGIWEILKRYEPVLLPNTTYRSYYYLFIIEAEKFPGNTRETFLFTVAKTNTGVYVRNSFFTSREEFVKPGKTIQGNQPETVQWSYW